MGLTLISYSIETIDQRVLETYAGKQLSLAATDV
jgi:hypothetical protein